MSTNNDLDILAARVRLRTAYVAAGLEDYDGQVGLRRLLLTPRLTLYAHLYNVPDASLLDVETNSNSLDGVFAEHAIHSSVVAEFGVANGTNVRLRQGESVICRGDDELVSIKLTHDDVITYRDQASAEELLTQTVRILDDLTHEGLLRCARVLHRSPPPTPKYIARDSLGSDIREV